MSESEILYMRKALEKPELLELRVRNEKRLAEAKLKLGTKYVYHKDNSPTREPYTFLLKK